jgi:hypothetical protein
MADLVPTGASVVPGTGASIQYGILGETVTGGQSLYLKASDGRLWKAQCDGTVAEAAVVGVSLNAGGAGQTVGYVANGPMSLVGATTAKTTTYLVSAAAGGIAPQADIVTAGFQIAIIGWATDTTGGFIVRPFVTGAVI